MSIDDVLKLQSDLNDANRTDKQYMGGVQQAFYNFDFPYFTYCNSYTHKNYEGKRHNTKSSTRPGVLSPHEIHVMSKTRETVNCVSYKQ